MFSFFKELLGLGTASKFDFKEVEDWVKEQISPDIMRLRRLCSRLKVSYMRYYEPQVVDIELAVFHILDSLYANPALVNKGISPMVLVNLVPYGKEDTPKKGKVSDYISIHMDFSLIDSGDDNATEFSTGAQMRGYESLLSVFPPFVQWDGDIHNMIVSFPKSVNAKHEVNPVVILSLFGDDAIYFKDNGSQRIALNPGTYVLCGANCDDPHNGHALRLTTDKLLSNHAILEVGESIIRMTAIGITFFNGERIDQSEYTNRITVSSGDTVSFGCISVEFI